MATINEFSNGIDRLMDAHNDAANEQDALKMLIQLKKVLELAEDIADSMALCECFTDDEGKVIEGIAGSEHYLSTGAISSFIRKRVKASEKA